MVNLAVLPRHAPTVLVTVDAQGTMSVVTLLEQVRPCWSRSAAVSQRDTDETAAVWVLEQIALGFGPAANAKPEDAPYAEIVIDRTYPARLYVYHPHGLEEIHVS
jgi:hypothetical protein